MKNKRGQVTLFVILGIIVILIIAIAVFLISQNKKKTDTDIFKEDYTAELAPIHDDVVFCMQTLGKEAIIKIGQTGGYIQVNPSDYTYNNYYVNQYDNDALELFPNSGIVIPYWTYISDAPSCRECSYSQSYPSLSTIQNSLKTYVERNLISCLNNFSAYKFDFDITYKKLPVCNVEIRDENVFFGVDWKVDVKFPDGTNDSVSKFTTTIDVRLKQIYEYALSIMFQTEMLENARAFEYFTKDILSFYSFGGEDAVIPPVSGPMSFEFTAPTIWIQSKVQTVLKNAVTETIPYMQVTGTKDSFVLFTNDSIKNNFYSNFQNVVYFNDDFASQIRVRFNYYPIWPFYVSVNPSDGAVIMPESSTLKLLLFRFSTTKYNFYYDISYPVLVTLEDDAAFNGEGFIFNYPFEVNLKENDPYSNGTIQMSDYMKEDVADEDLGYSQRTVPVTLSVIDGYTNLPIEGITVSYTCLDKEYIVGTSKITKENPNAMIESYLAPCIGGVFSMSALGYAESPVYLDIVLDRPVNLDYRVYSAKNISLELRKRVFEPTSPEIPIVDIDTNPYTGEVVEYTSATIDRRWAISTGEASTSTLEQDEEVAFMMNEIRSDGSTGNMFFVTMNGSTASSDKIMGLVPGKYSVNVVSTLKMGEGRKLLNINISARKAKEGSKIINIDEVDINDTMYLGGLKIDDTTSGYFVVTPQDLLTKSSLIVYYPSYHPEELKVVEDLDVLSKMLAANETNPDLFVPEFD